jgi:nucleoside-diphosphate-sugar epimerase
MIALFGAGGAVGRALAVQLDAQQTPYRVVGRKADVLAREFPAAQAHAADFLSGDGLDGAACGIETIFYLAGAPYTEFQKHPIMVRNALRAARTAGVSKFVHIAPVYSYGKPVTRPVPESQPHQPNTRKGRYRLEQERAVLEAGAAAFKTVVVHLPDFYGPNADLSYANAFIREALAGKTASWIGRREAVREFLYVPDAAAPLLRLAEDSDAFGRCWNLGGTSILARTFIGSVFETVGTRPKYQCVPKIVLQAVGLFNPLMREVAEMYYLFDSGFVLDDSALRARIGDWTKTPVTQGLRATVEGMRTHPG